MFKLNIYTVAAGAYNEYYNHGYRMRGWILIEESEYPGYRVVGCIAVQWAVALFAVRDYFYSALLFLFSSLSEIYNVSSSLF